MTITSGKPMSPTGSRTLVRTIGVPGLNDNNPMRIDLLSWQTRENEPQELEVLVYPMFRGAAELAADDNGAPTFYAIRLEISWSNGAGGLGNSQLHSTVQPRPLPALTANNRILSNPKLPDHGLRFRISCRQLSLKLAVPSSGYSFIAVASVQPVIGGAVSDPIPPIMAIGPEAGLIPYGAREFRVAKWPRSNTSFGYVPDPSATLRFYENVEPPAFGAASAFVFPVNTCTDWCVIPGEAVSAALLSPEAYGTIEYR
jgi:hypothetical protein